MAEPVAAVVADLAAEQDELARVVGSIGADAWLTPTPSRGWDVRDTIAHLADTDELAVDTCVGGQRALGPFAARLASPEDLTLWGVLRGRRRSGPEVLQWWIAAQRRERDVLAGLEPGSRVPWGLGMSPRAFATARLMETWAHGLDVRSALGVPARDTERLRHVAWISVRALPYAFTVAGREPPSSPIRVELTGPAGERWAYGPDDAADRITGPAGELCRVFVQRLDPAATTLRADGENAALALSVARAYL